jgi:hypothetical protein
MISAKKTDPIQALASAIVQTLECRTMECNGEWPRVDALYAAARGSACCGRPPDVSGPDGDE